EGMELRVRQLRAVHAAADAGAAQAELPDAVLELLYGEIRELQRDRSEGDEALGLGGADLGQLFILDADQLRDEIALGRIPVGIDAEDRKSTRLNSVTSLSRMPSSA